MRGEQAAQMAGEALDDQILEDGQVDRRWASSEGKRVRRDQALWAGEGLQTVEQIKASLPPPLRSALQGGRTEVFKFYYKACQPGEQIFNIDVHSLYPSQMIDKEYPVGHPRI